MEFTKKWGWYIVLVIIAIVLYALSIYLKLPEEAMSNISKYLTEDVVGKEITIYFAMSIAQLLLVIVFVKVLLAQRAFLDAIYNHFKTIFVEKSVINLYNEDELNKITQALDEAHPSINITYEKLRNESINLLEKEWKKGLFSKKSAIIIDYQNTDTIYSDGNEIKHKKIFFKMMKDDDFSYSFYFIPFDKIVNIEDYKDKKYNRWGEKSFKFIAKRINSDDETLEIEPEFLIDKEEGKDWLHIKFNHKSSRYRKLKKGDEFIIEFSISSPIDISNSDEAIERRKEYFVANYMTPCAIRSVKFQIETYNDNGLSFEPVIKINNDPLRVKPEESIYYKTWHWKFYHSESKEKTIDISIEKS